MKRPLSHSFAAFLSFLMWLFCCARPVSAFPPPPSAVVHSSCAEIDGCNCLLIINAYQMHIVHAFEFRSRISRSKPGSLHQMARLFRRCRHTRHIIARAEFMKRTSVDAFDAECGGSDAPQGRRRGHTVFLRCAACAAPRPIPILHSPKAGSDAENDGRWPSTASNFRF